MTSFYVSRIFVDVMLGECLNYAAVQILGTELSPVGENIYPDVDYWRILLSQKWEKRIPFFWQVLGNSIRNFEESCPNKEQDKSFDIKQQPPFGDR